MPPEFHHPSAKNSASAIAARAMSWRECQHPTAEAQGTPHNVVPWAIASCLTPSQAYRFSVLRRVGRDDEKRTLVRMRGRGRPASDTGS